jgi:hypothetical protein
MMGEIRGDLGELASKETLLEQPLVNKDLEAHAVLDGEGGKEVDHVAPIGLNLSHIAEFVA